MQRTSPDAGTVEPTAPDGLSQREAQARFRRGEGNVAVSRSARGYGRILRTNVFNFYNSILFTIGAALLALGRWNDALISVGLGLVNAAISAVQEIRAKRQLDRLQLLARELVTVVRDGQDVEVPPEQVVRGDVVHVRAGAQVVVDGPVLDGGRIEVDESLLTGESEPQLKEPGDHLLSGSFSVGGEGYQLARDVGAASYASRLTAEARQATTSTTPLQRQVGSVVRLIMLLVALMSATILLQAALEGFALVRVVQTTAVLSGLVPYGLFFLVAVAYTVGAARTADRGALVQRVNAVESISNVDVVCTDKTGTLTTGRLALAELVPLGAHEDVDRLVGSMARSAATPNLTSAALAGALPGEVWDVVDEVPFSSTLRWSALRTATGLHVLGALEALAPHLSGPRLDEAVIARTASGLRVLVVARAVERNAPLRDTAGRPMLPAWEAVALVALADELRAGVVETVTQLEADGVDLKVVSGDDPRTVAALARQAGLDGGEPVSGAELDRLSGAELDRVVARSTVFGRIAPEQKERLVDSLRRQGRYVAMIGDGVNDARALKRAQVGVAMRSGSGVTRDVADIVLTDDSMSALLPAQREGRRIIDGIGTSMQVFLVRVGAQGLVIVAVTMLGLGFPYSPAQVGLTLLTVGVPTLFLTAWARPAPPNPHLLADVARFVIPAAVVTAAAGVGVYAWLYSGLLRGLDDPDVPSFVLDDFEEYTGLSSDDVGFVEAAATIGAQTGLSTFVSYAAFLLILFLKPPTRLFASWTRPDGDRRPALLVAGLVVAFSAGLFVPWFTGYFGLTDAAEPVFFTVLPALLLWFVLLDLAYRFRLLDRALGLADLQPEHRRTGSAEQ